METDKPTCELEFNEEYTTRKKKVSNTIFMYWGQNDKNILYATIFDWTTSFNVLWLMIFSIQLYHFLSLFWKTCHNCICLVKKKLFYIKIPTRTVDQSHNGTEEQSNSGAVEQQNCGTVAQRNSGKKAHRNTVLLHLVTQLHYPISTPLPCFLYCRLQNEVYT